MSGERCGEIVNYTMGSNAAIGETYCGSKGSKNNIDGFRDTKLGGQTVGEI